MSTKKIKYKITDLLELQNKDLKENISFKELRYLILEYVEKDDIPKDEMLSKLMLFISEKLFPSYDLNEELVKFLEEVFVKLFNNFEIVIVSISRNQRTVDGSNIINYLNYWKTIFGQADKNIDLNIDILTFLAKYGLKFLLKYFVLIKDLESNNGIGGDNKSYLNEVKSESLNLHSRVLNTIESNTEIFKCSPNIKSSELFVNCLRELLNATKVLVTINIVACTRTLKLLLKLSILNSSYFESQIEKKYNWLEDTIKFLCDQVHFLLKQFHNKELNHETKNEINKYLKISSFFMQCIIKITENFDVQNISGFYRIIPLFFEIFKLKDTLNSEFLLLIEESLTLQIYSLIKDVYKTEDFMSEFLNMTSISTDNSAFCVLGLEIMNVLAVKKDQYEFSVYFYGQFFESIFNKIGNCPDIFLVPEFFDKIVKSSVSLLIFFHDNPDVVKVFEQILVKGMLQFNLVLSRVCFGIWVYLVSSLNDELCLHYFNFWIRIREKFPSNCLDPRIVQIQYLIRNIYDCLPNECKIQIWSEISMETSHLVFVLGIDRISNESKKISFKNCMQSKLLKKMRHVIQSNDFEKDFFVQLINDFKILSTSKVTNKNLKEIIIKVFKIVTHDTDFQKQEYFFNTYLKFVLKNFGCFTNSEKQSIYQMLEQVTMRPIKMSTKLYIRQFEDRAVQENIVFNNYIVNDDLNYYKHFTLFTNTCGNDKFVLMQNLKNLQLDDIHTWKCENINFNAFENSQQENEEPPLKRMKYLSEGQSRQNEFVANALQNAKTISNYFKYNNISKNEFNILNEIVKIYSDVINVKRK